MSGKNTSRDGYYIGGNCAIVMFDLTNRSSFDTVPGWVGNIRRVCGNIPIVVVGNKVDIRGKKVTFTERDAYFFRKNGLKYFEISARSNYNFEKPFLSLARQLTSNDSLVFIGNVTKPPEIAIDPNVLAEYNRQMELELSVPLPTDDEI